LLLPVKTPYVNDVECKNNVTEIFKKNNENKPRLGAVLKTRKNAIDIN
jgi:hypothetical protein